MTPRLVRLIGENGPLPTLVGRRSLQCSFIRADIEQRHPSGAVQDINSGARLVEPPHPNLDIAYPDRVLPGGPSLLAGRKSAPPLPSF
jgi:hypothetical protein